MTNTGEKCHFYDEIAPKEDIAEDYSLGMCCIKRDRLPLWIKDCGCDTYVHGDWKDCPTWTAPEEEPDCSDIPEADEESFKRMRIKPAVSLTHPAYLPLGEVCHGSGLLSDQFAAVLEFATRHRDINSHVSQAVVDATEHWELHFDADSEDSHKAFADLCDALNGACPPFCYFGANEGDGSSFGVWPNDDELEGAILQKKIAVVAHWLDVEHTSPTWEWVLVRNPNVPYFELYERKKGVTGRIWKAA